jgi:hypothetical protein
MAVVFIFLLLVMLPSTSSSSSSSGASKDLKACLKAAPKTLSTNEAKELCGSGAYTDEPSVCAKGLMKSAKSSHPFSAEEVVRFCKSARSHHPMDCVKSLHSKQSKFSVETKAGLCKHESETSKNFECTQRLNKVRGVASRQLSAGCLKSK